jgi:hypothetical protein
VAHFGNDVSFFLSFSIFLNTTIFLHILFRAFIVTIGLAVVGVFIVDSLKIEGVGNETSRNETFITSRHVYDLFGPLPGLFVLICWPRFCFIISL